MHVREVLADELDLVSSVCLDPSVRSEWKQIMEPCMVARKKWLKTMMTKGLEISVVFDSVRGQTHPTGLIEYVPIKYAAEPVEGGNSLFINCIWVIPPRWHRGFARVLLERAIEKAKAYGGLGVLAYEGDRWFGFFPYMPASFKKSGFEEVDRDGSRVLLHLTLGRSEKPKLIKPKVRKVKGDRLIVDVFHSCQCPWSGLMVDQIKQRIKKYDAVVKMIGTDNRKVVEKYGMSRGVCVNGVPIIKRMASWKEIEAALKAQKH
jgi:hypothetical protein